MSKEQTPVETPAKPKAPTFTIERLRKDCFTLFGITVSTFDGATYGLTRDFTVEEMRKTIEAWQNKPLQSKKEVN